jgi:hypothetical protein
MTAPLRALLLALTLLVAGVPVATAHDNDRRSRAAVTGQTTLALSDEAAKALADAGITATPVAPATAGDGGFTFPVERVKLKRRSLKVAHDGGITLTKGATTVTLTDLVVKAKRRHAKLFARAGNGKVALFKLRELKATKAENSLTVTAKAFLTRAAANGLNQAFGTTAFAKGAEVGTVTTTLTKASGTERRKKHRKAEGD